MTAYWESRESPCKEPVRPCHSLTLSGEASFRQGSTLVPQGIKKSPPLPSDRMIGGHVRLLTPSPGLLCPDQEQCPEQT